MNAVKKSTYQIKRVTSAYGGNTNALKTQAYVPMRQTHQALSSKESMATVMPFKQIIGQSHKN